MMRPRQFGPRIEPDGGVTFRLWAPAARSVALLTNRVTPMRRDDQGWYEVTLRDAKAGTRYRFRIDGELDVPDPASSFQPDDVSGPGEVIDHEFSWLADTWRGRPWHEAATLEIHIGTFTPEGTFLAAIDKLSHVVTTGFTAIELMPVADFSGRWNWGYDGVLPFAPDSTYGRPEDLKALIDAAHARGLMVFLDVVYNHFGPEGNYLGRYAPEFFDPESRTPWGAAIDYDVPEVRAFAIENALHWLDTYRFDGLRLDAIHSISKRGAPPILENLSRAVGALAIETDRTIHLILENDANTASLLDPRTDPPRGRYRAQWNDDYHHAWHVLLTGETSGYYRDFSETPRAQLARILSTGFAYQGEPSPHRGDEPRGEPSGYLPSTAFVSFLQNHDQIGNRPRGERIASLAPQRAIEAALAVMLLAPMPPLMFMGEEWGSVQPFPFFCDFEGDLAEAVREGRRQEFREAYASQQEQGSIPDPLDEATFQEAKLKWFHRDQSPYDGRLEYVERLLKLRREHIIPRMANLGDRHNRATRVGDAISVQWQLNGGTLSLVANLSDKVTRCPLVSPTRPIWGGEPEDTLAPWAVHWGWRGG